MFEWLIHVLDNGNSICDEWCLHFWEAIGTWFTGTATFAAVLVSLLLSRRQGIRMTVSAGVRLIVGTGAKPPFPEVLTITIRNIGSRPAPIEAVAWRFRPWRSRYGYQLFDPVGDFRGPPAIIEIGKSVTFKLPLSDRSRIRWADDLLKDFAGRYPRLGVRFVRIHAWTPAGQRCSSFIEPSLRQWILAKIVADADENKRKAA